MFYLHCCYFWKEDQCMISVYMELWTPMLMQIICVELVHLSSLSVSWLSRQILLFDASSRTVKIKSGLYNFFLKLFNHFDPRRRVLVSYSCKYSEVGRSLILVVTWLLQLYCAKYYFLKYYLFRNILNIFFIWYLFLKLRHLKIKIKF
jgi:hypothetical protein